MPQHNVRVPDSLYAAVLDDASDKLLNVSEWVRQAIREKLLSSEKSTKAKEIFLEKESLKKS